MKGIIQQIEESKMYPDLTLGELQNAIKKVFSESKNRKSNEFRMTEYVSLDQYKEVLCGSDEFQMAMCKEVGSDPLKWKVNAFIKRNIMTKEEQREYEKCNFGTKEMSGPEYFWYNYCKVNGELPELGSWSKEGYEQYKSNVLLKRNIKKRRGYSWKDTMASPISIEQAFRLKNK